MKCNRVTSVVLATSVSTLLGCSSAEKVVSANVLSSNDNQYNATTENGRKGGLIKPGIPEGILDPTSQNPQRLRAASKVRISLAQDGQSTITREVEPQTNSWTVDELGPDGKPVLDEEGNPVKEEHQGIAQFFERITLTDGWRGDAEATAEALDDAGDVVLSAAVTFTVEEKGAVYVPIDLKIPSPEATGGAAGAGGSSGVAGAAGSSNLAGSAGTAGTMSSSAGSAGTMSSSAGSAGTMSSSAGSAGVG